MGASGSKIVFEIVCPATGMLVTQAMWIAPWADVQEASGSGEMGDLNPMPWIFMLANTIGWCVYAILDHNYWVFAAEIGGFLLSIYYNLQAVKLQFYGHHSGQLRESIIAALNESSDLETARATETVADMAQLVWGVASLNVPAPAPHEYFIMATMTFWTIIVTVISFSGVSTSNLIHLVGYINVVTAILLSAAPLSSILHVIRNCSSESIHRPTLVSNFANNAFWGAYGVAIGDMFLAAPAVIGMVLSGLQFALVLVIQRYSSDRLDLKTEDQTADSTQNEESTNELVGETPSLQKRRYLAQEIMVDDEEGNDTQPERVRPSLPGRANSVQWLLESDLLPRNYVRKSSSIRSLNRQNSIRFELQRNMSLRHVPARSYSERPTISDKSGMEEEDETLRRDKRVAAKPGLSRTSTTRF